MALTQDAKIEIRDLAELFVGAFVKCGKASGSKYAVTGDSFNSIEEAVNASLEKCGRLPIGSFDMEEQEEVLRYELQAAIKNLRCP